MRILSIQHALPSLKVSNEELVQIVMNREENKIPAAERRALRERIFEHLHYCGAHTRFLRSKSEKSVDLGIQAGESALVSAGLAPDDVGLLIYVGVGRGVIEPATANIFQDAIGLKKATCFDVLDACASWIRALDLARRFLDNHRYRYIMLLNSEFNFHEYLRADFRSISDLEFLGAGLTIGEAATATVIGYDHNEDNYYSSFRTQGTLHRLCQIPLRHQIQYQIKSSGPQHPPNKFYAYSTRLHKAAISMMVKHYWDESAISEIEPDIIFGHSTSVPAARSVLNHLRLDPSRYVDIFPGYGNTVSASVPLAMLLAEKQGRLKRGQTVFIAVTSAGVTSAFCRFTY